MNNDNYPFSFTNAFSQFRIAVPLGLLSFALVAASACESFENEDPATDASLRGSSSGTETGTTQSCVSMDRRLTAERTVTLRCDAGKVIQNITLRHGGTCERPGGCAVPAGSLPSSLERDCVGQRQCEIDVSRLPFSCPSSQRESLRRTDNRGGAAAQRRLSSTPVSTVSAWYECRANDHVYSEEELHGMLEQCRTQISARLPSFDSAARDAFMASHRAESNNTGTMQDSGYRDAAEVAQTAALARPLLSAPSLDNFISDNSLDVTLVRCAVLANILEETSGLETTELSLISKLLQDQALMKQILVAGGPRGNRYGEALQVYKDLQSANPRAKDGIFQKLALAISLELAAPELMGTYDLFEPMGRYRFYEDSYLQGELIDQFADFTPWEYRQVIDANASDEDLKWMREMLHNLRPDFIFNATARDRFVAIQSEEDLIPQVPVQFDENLPYSWFQQVVAKGGQCGAKARVVRTLLRSFGVPTWGFQISGHDGVGYWTREGWTSNLKVQWENGYYKTAARSEYMTALIFLLEAHSRTFPDEYLKALRLEWVGDVLGEEDIDLVYAGRGGLWNALALNKKRIIDQDLYADPPWTGYTRIPKPTDSDKEIATHANGSMTIPAVATAENFSYNGTLKVIVDRNDDFLLHYRRKEDIVPFSYIVDVPRAGSYALRADVVTVTEGQSFMLTVNDGQTATRLDLPYTVGMWKTSDPVTVSLAKGQNKLTFSREKPEDLGTHSMWWYCINYSDPGCGGITIRSFDLTPL